MKVFINKQAARVLFERLAKRIIARALVRTTDWHHRQRVLRGFGAISSRNRRRRETDQ